MPFAEQVPRDAVPGQLGRRDQAQALVVGLIKRALPIQEAISPLAPVAADAGKQRQVVIPAGHVNGIELEGTQPVEDPHDARRLGGQGAGRSEQVAEDEVTASHHGGNDPGHERWIVDRFGGP
jgi:hypothetical protein